MGYVSPPPWAAAAAPSAPHRTVSCWNRWIRHPIISIFASEGPGIVLGTEHGRGICKLKILNQMHTFCSYTLWSLAHIKPPVLLQIHVLLHTFCSYTLWSLVHIRLPKLLQIHVLFPLSMVNVDKSPHLYSNCSSFLRRKWNPGCGFIFKVLEHCWNSNC